MEKNYKKLHELSNEFEKYLKSLQGFFLDSLLGYKLIMEEMRKEGDFLKDLIGEDEVTTEDFQNTTSFNHEQKMKEEMPLSGLFFHKKGDLKKRNRKNGDNQKVLIQTMIVNLYSYWEEYLREEVALAYGYKEKKEYKNEFWGLLREIRHSILHNQGRMTEDFIRLTKKYGVPSKEDAYFNFDTKFIRTIFLEAYKFKNQLYYESSPRRTITIPKKL